MHVTAFSYDLVFLFSFFSFSFLLLDFCVKTTRTGSVVTRLKNHVVTLQCMSCNLPMKLAASRRSRPSDHTT